MMSLSLDYWGVVWVTMSARQRRPGLSSSLEQSSVLAPHRGTSSGVVRRPSLQDLDLGAPTPVLLQPSLAGRAN